MNIHIKYLFLLFILMINLGACQNENLEYNNHNNQLSTNSNFIRLLDDSTQIAGTLQIAGTSSVIDLKWNLPTNCNLDTTATKINLIKGQGILSIKWDKKTNEGNYGPINAAYEGGVLLSSGEESKYIPLFWTENLDSTKVSDRLQMKTRSSEELPRAASVSLHPSGNVTMDQDNGGSVYVAFTGTPVVSIDATGITSDTHIDKTKIDNLLTEPGIVKFVWTAEKAPNFNFARTVKFSASETAFVTAKLIYTVPDAGDPIYKFISSSPVSGGTLPAVNASVDVVVYTNKEWSLDSDFDLAPPTNDPNAFGPENKRLTIPIMDNPDTNSRTVTITVKSQGVEKDVLTFTQLGSGQIGTFEFVSSDPVDNTSIPGTATDIKITVKTDLAWYIDCNVCNPLSFEAVPLSIQTKSYTIPANTTINNRIITVTISSGNPSTEKKIQFIQLPKSGDPDFTLIYSTSNLPAGNIPVAGAIYQFEFTGTYTGGVQVRAVVDGVSQVSGQIVTDKKPQCLVSANALNTTRNIQFEYKRADGDWLPLPAETNRLQEGTGGGTETGSVQAGLLTPNRNLWEYGEDCSCEFTGDFTGTIILRAKVGNEELVRNTGKVNSVISVAIPQLNGLNRIISFEYSINNGTDWVSLGSRNQINEYLSFVDLQPSGKNMPANGLTYTWGIGGSYSKNVTFQVSVDSTDDGNQIYEESASPIHTFSVTIPKNPKKQARAVIFRYKLEDDVKWTIIDIKYQNASK